MYTLRACRLAPLASHNTENHRRVCCSDTVVSPSRCVGVLLPCDAQLLSQCYVISELYVIVQYSVSYYHIIV